MSIFSKFFGIEDPVKTAKPYIEKINALEAEFEKLSHDQLKEKTKKWRDELIGLQEEALEEKLSEVLPEAFAAVREAAKRTLGQRHFDVQLIGGIALHRGKIAEMKTGEGKTLTSTLAVYLNALTRGGVHVVTVNDYLARRDASWMGQVFHYLGLSVGAIQHQQSFLYTEADQKDEEITPDEESGVQIDVRNLKPCSRRDAYHADITYGTNNEFGFDYLRDNMAQNTGQLVQRELNFTIVDEVDSILIDEARTPLIISAPDAESTDLYREFAGFAKGLDKDDYTYEEKYRHVNYTEKGYEKLEQKYGQEIYSDIKLRHHADVALRAQTAFTKDKDYVVRAGEIVIVDEFTGRLMEGRRYSEGLHQAIEAKESVTVKQESKTLATITFQNYFRLYNKLSGMTGTAATEQEEFHKIYNLDVAEIPTNRPLVRRDLADSVYKTTAGKYQAIVREIRQRQQNGQPILVGTISIEKNEYISKQLKKAGIRHEILNAKNHEREAQIIAQAGRPGSVTLATNIAGRGVDIILGGNPFDEQAAKKVKDAGGLHVLGTERHESRRIDNQLRGRSGRQGDPGSTQFFLSLEDDLMRVFGGDRVGRLMETLGLAEDQPIEHGMISKTIEGAQKKIEGMNFDARKHVLEFDDVLNKQREAIYSRRRKILEGSAELRDEILDDIKGEIADIANSEEDEKQKLARIAGIFPLSGGELKNLEKNSRKSPELLINDLTSKAEELYKQREEKFSPQVMRQIERMITLRAIDSYWMNHLDTMDHLRQSVRLRGYAQKDPLVEYKQDGRRLFQEMMNGIENTIVYTIFKLEVKPKEQGAVPHTHTHSSGMPASSLPPHQKLGRNDPCYCGSGKKYKKCHGK